MAAYGFPDNPSVTTSSRLRAWWLQKVCGYHVVRVRHHLQQGRFGHIRYAPTFLMTPNTEIEVGVREKRYLIIISNTENCSRCQTIK